MKVGFTGTRKGMTKHQIEQLEDFLADNYVEEFHHGDCVGADEQAHQEAQLFANKIVVHPPIDSKYRAYTLGDLAEVYDPQHWGLRKEKEYLERNHDIVDETDFLVAAPKGPEELRSGTWATIRYAKKQGKPVYILER